MRSRFRRHLEFSIHFDFLCLAKKKSAQPIWVVFCWKSNYKLSTLQKKHLSLFEIPIKKNYIWAYPYPFENCKMIFFRNERIYLFIYLFIYHQQSETPTDYILKH
jgi:hypothetical protein